MKKLIVVTVVVVALAVLATMAFSHCEVPCGIYGDQTRFTMLEEHITTIEKAMGQIEHISKEKNVNYNQLVRWVNTKEKHADEIQHVVAQYFMTQRVKPAAPEDKAQYAKYVHELTLLHQTLVAAMKTKQTTDAANTAKLKSLVGQFKASYLGLKREGS